MEDSRVQSSHLVRLGRREEGTITGVTDVITFDTREIILDTLEGGLVIKGDHLHVKKLTLEKGEVEITGRMDSLIYTNKKKKDSDTMMSRLFR